MASKPEADDDMNALKQFDEEELEVVGNITFKPSFEVLPDTKRTEELNKKRREALIRKREEAENAIKRKREEQAKRRQLEQQKKKQEEIRKKKEREAERKRLEEEEQMRQMQGGLNQIVDTMFKNTTAPHVSMCGISLYTEPGPYSVNLRLLTKSMADNHSCMSLDLNRKGLSDEDGLAIATMLETNACLQKLEVEGNNLGVLAAERIGQALRTNRCLRSLNLESNNLTASANDQKGVLELANALKENNCLRVLMLSKNGITAQAGDYFVRAIEANESLTLVDLSGNDPSLSVEQLRAIDRAVQRNRERQSAIRRAERRERYALYNEEFKCRQHYMQVEAMRLEIEAHEERRLNRMKARFEKWSEEVKEMKEAEQAKMMELKIDAEDRALDAPKKKGKRK